MGNEFLKFSGDYHDWSVYRKSTIVSDVTEMFIRRAFPDRTRTIDQMRQAALSCKQNIIEGIRDKVVSAEMCIKLIGVARGSLRELREDYEDFLRQNKHEIWGKDNPKTEAVRRFNRTHNDPLDYVQRCEVRSDETVANIMLTLAYQLDAMLAKVMKALEEDFLEEGGIKEAMARARRKKRGY